MRRSPLTTARGPTWPSRAPPGSPLATASSRTDAASSAPRRGGPPTTAPICGAAMTATATRRTPARTPSPRVREGLVSPPPTRTAAPTAATPSSPPRRTTGPARGTHGHGGTSLARTISGTTRRRGMVWSAPSPSEARALSRARASTLASPT